MRGALLLASLALALGAEAMPIGLRTAVWGSALRSHVDPDDPRAPVPLPAIPEKTYDGAPHAADLPDSALWTASPSGARVDAGLYEVTLELVDPDGTRWADDRKGATRTLTWAILPRRLSDAMVGGVATQEYAGRAVTPKLKVVDAELGAVLVSDRDYVLKWSGNIDPGTATVTITGIGNYSGRVVRTFTIKPPYKLTVKSGSTKRGTASGSGSYAAGSRVTIKAKAKKGCVFAGWFTDKACAKALNPKGYDNRKPTVKIVMPKKKTTVYAKFLTAAEDRRALKFKSSTRKLAKTAAKAAAGKAFSLRLGISSASYPRVTAKGLPKGLAIDKTTGEISGTATKPGSYTVVVTVKDAEGYKISQKVKIRVLAAGYARGTFYGTARPGDAGDPAAYLKFTVGSTGKVSGKVTYKGKARPFTSALSYCSAKKARFSPKVQIGGRTFKPGTVTILQAETAGGPLVEAANKKSTFTGQKKADFVKKGGALASLVGMRFTFTKDTPNSGLVKGRDSLEVMLGNGDKVKVSGTVRGKALAPLSAPLLVSEAVAIPGAATYTLYADILDAGVKYYRTIVFTATVPTTLDPVPAVSVEFAE